MAQNVIDAVLSVGPTGPEPRDGGVYDARIDLFHALVVHTQPLDNPHAEVLRDDVGGLGHIQEKLAALGAFQVEGDAPLVAVHGLKVRADLSLTFTSGREVAAGIAVYGVLDLDDIGPHVREHDGAPRPVLIDRHVENLNAVQRSLHHTLLLACLSKESPRDWKFVTLFSRSEYGKSTRRRTHGQQVDRSGTLEAGAGLCRHVSSSSLGTAPGAQRR